MRLWNTTGETLWTGRHQGVAAWCSFEPEEPLTDRIKELLEKGELSHFQVSPRPHVQETYNSQFGSTLTLGVPPREDTPILVPTVWFPDPQPDLTPTTVTFTQVPSGGPKKKGKKK